MMRMKISAAVCVASGLLWTMPLTSVALDIDQEFDFASGLIELGFPDLANRVVSEVVRLHPDQRDRATRIEGEILIAQRRFSDAEALVETMPEGHPQRYALQLRIANGHFRAGNTEEAQRLYDAFFAVYQDRTPTDPDLLRFYQDAAYQYGQMMERMNNRRAAAESYDRLLRAGVDDTSAKRRLQMDLARLYLQLGRETSGSEQAGFLDQAFALSEEVQWGGYDLWFGQSIGIMAHVHLVRGDAAGARDLLEQYMDDLRRIDRLLREQNVPASVSPVANARFLLGELYEKRVEELRARNAPEREVLQAIQQALTEYYNVFGQYGTSQWGAEASVRGRELITMLERDFGREVNINFGDHGGEAAQAQYTMADDLFRQRNYERAIQEYLTILNQFPEGQPSLRALANLLLSYLHTDNELYVRMLAAYLAERFAGENIAASALLMASRQYVERGNEEMYNTLFDYYFAGFPQHERAPQLLFDMARRRQNAGDNEQAMEYFQRIVDNYPRDRFALRAQMAIAMSHHQNGEYEAAAEQFRKFVEAASPGHDRVRAQFLMADSLQRQSQYVQAIQAYGQILRWLGRDNAPDNARPEDAERNARLAERSLFFVGYGHGRIQEPANQVPAFRERGITAYRQFLERHPESSLAPTAMRDKGALLLELGRSQEAAQVFEDLAARYPDSEEGRSALFALVSSAFEIGQPEIARDAFRRMIETPDAYSPEEFTRIGQLMLDNGMYEDVIPAYRRVVETTEERRMLELALFGLGSAYHHQGNYSDSIEALDDLLERFPNTPFFFDARFLLADANKQIEQYDAAHAALSDILRLSQDNLVNQRAQFSLASLQQARGEHQAALATYQRIALLQDPSNRDLRPIIEQSLRRSLEIAMELSLYQEVEDVSAQYLEDFAQSEHVEEVRRIRADARRRAIQ